MGGGRVQDHLRHIVQGLCGDKIRYVAYAMYSIMVAPDIVFFSFGNSQRDEVNLNLLSSDRGLDDGLVKHVYVWPAPSVTGPGDNNLLSYVYRLGSSAAAHLDYITLRLLVTINIETVTLPMSVSSIPLQISSFMY